MRCHRSLEIGQRPQTVLELFQVGRYHTPGLAAEVCVSFPTISRCVDASRERRHDIRAVRRSGVSQHVLADSSRRRGISNWHSQAEPNLK
jgi:hypothetical protein